MLQKGLLTGHFCDSACSRCIRSLTRPQSQPKITNSCRFTQKDVPDDNSTVNELVNPVAEVDSGSVQEFDEGKNTNGEYDIPLQLHELRVLTLDYDAHVGVAEACKAYEKREDEDEEDCEGHPITCLDDLCTPAAPATTTAQVPASTTSLAHSHFGGDATLKKRKRKRKSKAMKQQDPNIDHEEVSTHSRASQCPLAAADTLERAEKKREKAREAKRQRKRNKKSRLHEGPFNANVAINLAWSVNHGKPDIVHTIIGAGQLDAANGAWVGVRKPAKQRVTALAEGTRGGLRLLQWDGECVRPIRLHCHLPHILTGIPLRSLTRTSGCSVSLLDDQSVVQTGISAGKQRRATSVRPMSASLAPPEREGGISPALLLASHTVEVKRYVQ